MGAMGAKVKAVAARGAARAVGGGAAANMAGGGSEAGAKAVEATRKVAIPRVVARAVVENVAAAMMTVAMI
jgi:hypothetical protein